MKSKTNILDSQPYLRQALDLIADKWVVATLYVLSSGTKRYGELQRGIGDISQRMLTRTLRDLERNGLVHREVYPVVPPKVEYSITPLGRTLNDVLRTLCKWSLENFNQVEAARDAYDNGQAESS
ncbi:helix-turn-helix domain-containing protein [Acaryochloris sp. CCMEE 5410]|uniref:winged helix-turn-helix transcriptional regulator n=1 Tax=Acaryochloris sp. CCMEE 5410 TaxID=310037 RepID=UPI0002483B6A|nr:helix-turn-helix domain-containing protein [Acaryochloris sp. CCMEE 5410]KAI9129988.1 helix-turn-helix transcriptional regulator [Acaryochloris sp. CCMEE 5410]